MSPYIPNTGLRFPYPSNCAQQNLNFIIKKNYRKKEDLTKKVVTSPLDSVDMQEKRKDADYIIKKDTCKTSKCDNKTCDKEPPNNC